MIYLDNAATTIHKPQGMVDAVISAFSGMGNSGRGAHNAALNASRVVYATREKAAELFGVEKPENVIFTANATMSLNIAIRGVLQPGDHVVTTACEHNSVLRPIYLLEKEGVTHTIVSADQKGQLSYEEIRDGIQPNTKLVVCTHASNLTGNVFDINKIGHFCRERGILFLVDASQTAGVLPIDMQKMKIDLLCTTGHKGLMGPQGTGLLCVGDGIQIKPFLVGGSGIHSFQKTHPDTLPAALEAGTLNGHGIAGLGASLDFLRQVGIDEIHKREQALMEQFYYGVKDIPGVKVYGSFMEQERTAIVTLNIREYDSGEVADILAQDYEILTRAGAHCAPLMHEALGTCAQGAVRFSMGYFNTEEEMERAITAVSEIAAE
ncbi:MAG: aminotransferase class V-fold PLP-dependent enzyme [Lachnospiraceae bacterium]